MNAFEWVGHVSVPQWVTLCLILLVSVPSLFYVYPVILSWGLPRIDDTAFVRNTVEACDIDTDFIIAMRTYLAHVLGVPYDRLHPDQTFTFLTRRYGTLFLRPGINNLFADIEGALGEQAAFERRDPTPASIGEVIEFLWQIECKYYRVGNDSLTHHLMGGRLAKKGRSIPTDKT